MEKFIDKEGTEWRQLIIDKIYVWVSETGYIRYQYVSHNRAISVCTKGSPSTHGYLRVTIKNKSYAVSRLVAAAFLFEGLPLSKPSKPYDKLSAIEKLEVDHIGSRDDNSVKNLRLTMDRKANCGTVESRERYSKANRNVKKFGTIGYQALGRDGQIVREFKSDDVWTEITTWLAEHEGVTASRDAVKANVGLVCQNKKGHYSAYGFGWKRIVDKNWKHAPYYEYQSRYHKEWSARKKAALGANKPANDQNTVD